MNNAKKSPIRNAFFGAGLILAIALAVRLLNREGLVAEHAAERILGVVMGSVLMITGNAIPKNLKPLSSMRCDPATVQSVQRAAGRIFVLAGFIYALIWVLAPLSAASWLSTAVGVTAILSVGALWIRAKRKPVGS